MSMFKVGKGSPGVLNSITSQKLLPLNPPSPSEFPMIFRGGGMDIFWNHTFNKNSSLKFCELERYIPAAQTQSKPQRVVVLVCRLQKSSTGDNNFVKWGGGTFQFDRPKWQDQSKWTTFKAQSWIFQSDQTEMVRSIWWTNQNKFWNFGLNGKRPRTPLSQGY